MAAMAVRDARSLTKSEKQDFQKLRRLLWAFENLRRLLLVLRRLLKF